MANSISSNGLNFIKGYETLSLTVYDDGFGYLTVGYGHKVVSSDNLKLGDKITQSQANQFLSNDVKKVEDALNGFHQINRLNQAQYDATASLLFNCGTSLITNKRNDLYTTLSDGSIYARLTSDTSVRNRVINAFTYTKVNGNRVSGLVRRRNEELSMFFGEPSSSIYIR